MRMRRDSLGHFVSRRRNPAPKGGAKTIALQGALTRRVSVDLSRPASSKNRDYAKQIARAHAINRRTSYHARTGNPAPRGKAKTAALSSALSRRFRHHAATGRGAARVVRLHGAIQRRRRTGNPAPKGARKAGALLAAASRRARVRRVGHQLHQFALTGAAARRLRVSNPKRKRQPMARRRRTAAQRAAFRKMIAGLRRSRGGKRRTTRRKKGAHSMARRRRRSVGARRSRRAVMVNPPRRRHGRRVRHGGRRRMHHRRRRNPGMGGGIKGALKTVFMAAIPALGGGFVANFIDAKFLADKNIVVRILAKLAQAGAAAMLFRNKPVIAYATMGAIIGSVGGDFGTRMAGGVVVGATPVAKAQGVAALITEDPRTMGVLVEGMRGMGYQIDSNVSLGDPSALPAGSYQDVNLG